MALAVTVVARSPLLAAGRLPSPANYVGVVINTCPKLLIMARSLAVAMSGGVDSSVAALLLKRAGIRPNVHNVPSVLW